MYTTSAKYSLKYSISKEEVSPDQKLIEKILKVSIPKIKKELASFSRLVNFYRQYLPEYIELTEPFAKKKKRKKCNLYGRRPNKN